MVSFLQTTSWMITALDNHLLPELKEWTKLTLEEQESILYYIDKIYLNEVLIY
jgi:hypothetical protein